MSHEKKLSRQDFLKIMATVSGSAALASCAPKPTAAPAATAAPTKAPTKAPTAVPPTATPVPVEEPKIGSHLIGKLEGYEIILDESKFPTSFSEAPMLAELVKAGKLPPVEERLPKDIQVVKPVHEIGKYGGTWRRAFTGASDGENGNRLMATDKFLFWDYTGTQIVPAVAKKWEVSEDGREVTLWLREGHKWSDGEPFTADDCVFWFEDLYSDPEIGTATSHMNVNGKPGKVVKVDDHTIKFAFEDPNFLFEAILPGDTWPGRGSTTGQFGGRFWGGYSPKHYLKQFLPKYAEGGVDALTAKAKEAGFDTWLTFLQNKVDWERNVELPVLAPWHCITPITDATWAMERNPYFYEVDTAGNQLPYIDKIVLTMGENLEVINLRAIAGEIDYQARHMDLTKLPVFLENQEKGGYIVHLDPGFNGADTVLHVNHSFEADPEVSALLRSADFRRALSMGIDREQFNEIWFLGLATPGSPVVDDGSPENPGKEYRTMWSTLDVAKANELLDKLGLDKRDADGFRMRKDGAGPLRIEIQATAAFLPWPKHAETLKEYWENNLKIRTDTVELERTLMVTRATTNDCHISLWYNGGTEQFYLYTDHALPISDTNWMGGPIGRWWQTAGKEGMEPPEPWMKQAFEMLGKASGMKLEERNKNAQEIWKILVDQQCSIGTCGLSPASLGCRIVNAKIGNAPARHANAQHMRTPSGSHTPCLYYKS